MRPKLVLFGDSITEHSFDDGGWGAALAHHFSRTADVVLRGYSGYNTRWAVKGLRRAMDDLHNHKVFAVTVFFGANDACLPDRSGAFQHVPLPEYQSNLRTICSNLEQWWPVTVVILITPPPIDEDGRIKNPYGDNTSGQPERTNEFAGAYAKACIAVASEYGIPVVDIWSKMQQFPGWQKRFLCDGLHLTAEGNKIVFEEVVKKLNEERISPESLPVDLPLLAELYGQDPLNCFQ